MLVMQIRGFNQVDPKFNAFNILFIKQNLLLENLFCSEIQGRSDKTGGGSQVLSEFHVTLISIDLQSYNSSGGPDETTIQTRTRQNGESARHDIPVAL